MNVNRKKVIPSIIEITYYCLTSFSIIPVRIRCKWAIAGDVSARSVCTHSSRSGTAYGVAFGRPNTIFRSVRYLIWRRCPYMVNGDPSFRGIGHATDCQRTSSETNHRLSPDTRTTATPPSLLINVCGLGVNRRTLKIIVGRTK